MPNALRKPLADVRVRQALNYATDVDAIIKNVLDGQTLSGVDLRVAAGAITGLIGPNGGEEDHEMASSSMSDGRGGDVSI